MSELGDHIEALKNDPLSETDADAIRSLAKDDGDHRAMAAAFADRGRALADRGHDDAVSVLIEAAQTYQEELEELEPAANLYETVLELEPDHRRALFALGLLLHDLGRVDELIALYTRRLESSRDDGERTTLHLYIAELLSEKKGQDGAAFQEVMKAARLAPQNLRIITRLETLGERTERLDEVAVVLGDLILHAEDPKVRAGLSLRLAELQTGPLNDPARGLACFRSALVDDGGNPEILSEIHDVFREQERFDELAEILEETSRERRTGPQRGRMERELAIIYEHELGDMQRALSSMAKAARSNPDDREILDEVMRLGLMSSDMDTVAEAFEDVVAGTTKPLLRTYAQLKLGHLYATSVAKPAEAVRVYKRILENDPDHIEVLKRLARVYKDKLEQPTAALELYRRVLRLAPDDSEAQTAAAAALSSIPESTSMTTPGAEGETDADVDIIDEMPLPEAELIDPDSSPTVALVDPEADLIALAEADAFSTEEAPQNPVSFSPDAVQDFNGGPPVIPVEAADIDEADAIMLADDEDIVPIEMLSSAPAAPTSTEERAALDAIAADVVGRLDVDEEEDAESADGEDTLALDASEVSAILVARAPAAPVNEEAADEEPATTVAEIDDETEEPEAVEEPAAEPEPETKVADSAVPASSVKIEDAEVEDTAAADSKGEPETTIAQLAEQSNEPQTTIAQPLEAAEEPETTIAQPAEDVAEGPVDMPETTIAQPAEEDTKETAEAPEETAEAPRDEPATTVAEAAEESAEAAEESAGAAEESAGAAEESAEEPEAEATPDADDGDGDGAPEVTIAEIIPREALDEPTEDAAETPDVAVAETPEAPAADEEVEPNAADDLADTETPAPVGEELAAESAVSEPEPVDEPPELVEAAPVLPALVKASAEESAAESDEERAAPPEDIEDVEAAAVVGNLEAIDDEPANDDVVPEDASAESTLIAEADEDEGVALDADTLAAVSPEGASAVAFGESEWAADDELHDDTIVGSLEDFEAAAAPSESDAGAEDEEAEEEAPPSIRSANQVLEDRIVALQQSLQDATRADDRLTQTMLLDELVRLNEETGNFERAFIACVRRARLAATGPTISELIRVGHLAQQDQEVVSVFDEVSPRLDLESEIHYGLKIARLEASQLSDTTSALGRIADLHDIAQDDEEIFSLWIELLAEDGRWDALIGVLRHEARRVTSEERAQELYLQAARICEKDLEEPSRAAALLLEWCERAPEDKDLRNEACRLLEVAGDWTKLAEVLEANLYRVPVDKRGSDRRRIARIYLDQLEQPRDAELTLRAAVEEAPDDDETFDMLADLYSSSDRWTDLADLLARRITTTRGPKARNTIRKRLSGLAERHLFDRGLALRHLEDAADDDPSDLDVLTEIHRLRTDAEDWRGVAEVLVLRSHALTDASERADALVASARIRDEKFADEVGASAAYRDALAIDPDHIDALNGFADLADRTGDDSAAIDALRRVAKLIEPSASAVALTRAGRLLETRLGNNDAASEAYEAAVEADGRCLEALEALRQYHQRHGDKARALELCVREADLTENPVKSAMLWGRAAELALHDVGDSRRAIECYEKALEADANDLETRATLGQLYVESGDDRRALPAVLEAAEGIADFDKSRAFDLFITAGGVADRLGRPPEAKEAYSAANKIDGAALKPLLRLGDLLGRSDDASEAYEVNASLLLHHEAELSPNELGGVYLRMAAAKHRLGELDDAIRLADKSRELLDDPRPCLALLVDVLAAGDHFSRAAAAASKLAELTEERDEKKAVLIRAARLYGDDDDDLSRAIPLLIKASRLDPEDTHLATLLANFRERAGLTSEAASGLADAARRLEGRERADMLIKAARLAAGSGRERKEATKLLDEAMELCPTHLEGLHDLAVMLEFDGEHQRLARLNERAAKAFLEDSSTTSDTVDGDRSKAAAQCFEVAYRLYRFRLRLPFAALRVAKARRPLASSVVESKEDLARVLDAAAYAAPDEQRDLLLEEAEEAWAEIVEEHPGHLHALRRLHALRVERKEPLLARITAEILVALGEANAAERDFVGVGGRDRTDAQPLPFQAPQASGVKVPLSEVEANVEDGLFAKLGFAPLAAFSDALPDPKLKKRDRAERNSLGPHVSAALDDAARVLGLNLPVVYARDDAPGPIVPVFAEGQPALLLSQALAADLPAASLRFHAGRAMSLLRPRALAIAVLPLDVLRDGLEGFVKDEVSDKMKFSESRRAKKRGRQLEKAVPSDRRGAIQLAVKSWLQDPTRRTLFDERAGILRTAERMGLVASGSVLLAVQALSSSGRVDRGWFMPLIEFGASRQFASVVGGKNA